MHRHKEILIGAKYFRLAHRSKAEKPEERPVLYLPHTKEGRPVDLRA